MAAGTASPDQAGRDTGDWFAVTDGEYDGEEYVDDVMYVRDGDDEGELEDAFCNDCPADWDFSELCWSKADEVIIKHNKIKDSWSGDSLRLVLHQSNERNKNNNPQ